MTNHQQRDPAPATAGQIEQPRPESFAARRMRVINAVRTGRRRQGPAPTTTVSLALGDSQTVADPRPDKEITPTRSQMPLPRRTPRAQVADDAGLEPTQKHDPREHYTVEQLAQLRTSLMGLGE